MCIYICTSGQDVICLKTGKILGDIMGYDGIKCNKCKYREDKKKK